MCGEGWLNVCGEGWLCVWRGMVMCVQWDGVWMVACVLVFMCPSALYTYKHDHFVTCLNQMCYQKVMVSDEISLNA